MEGESSSSSNAGGGTREWITRESLRQAWGAIGAEVFDFSDLPPELNDAVRAKCLVMNDEAQCEVRVKENGDIVVGKSKTKDGTGAADPHNAVVAVVATKDPDTNQVVMNIVCKLADEEVTLTNPKNQQNQK